MEQEFFSYPSFVANQVLTPQDLNNSFSYLDEQTRMSRVFLNGTGIECGLQVSVTLDPYSGGQAYLVTVDCGTGVTSEGYLIKMDQVTFNKVGLQPFTFSSSDPYPPLTPGSGTITIHELFNVPTTNYPDLNNSLFLPPSGVTPISIPSILLDGMVVVLLIDLSQTQPTNCDAQSCDSMGITVNVTPRVLLISEADINKLNLGSTGGGVFITSLIQSTSVLNIQRFNVPAALTTICSTGDFFNAYQQSFTSTLLSNMQTAFSFMYNILSPMIAGLPGSDPFANFYNLNSNTGKYSFFTNPNGLLALTDSNTNITGGTCANNISALFQVQYYYDHFVCLIAAYNDLCTACIELSGQCCPDNTFPRHLLDGFLTADTSNPPQITWSSSNYYNGWAPSPATSEYNDELNNIGSLYTRLVQMDQNFYLADVSSYGSSPTKPGTDTGIIITPTISGPVPLGEKAIPFFYNGDSGAVPAKLLNSWNPELSSLNRASWNLSYWATFNGGQDSNNNDLLVNPNAYDLEDYNFFRVEGIIGKHYSEVLANLESLISNYRLPFQIVVTTTGSCNCEVLNPTDGGSTSGAASTGSPNLTYPNFINANNFNDADNTQSSSGGIISRKLPPGLQREEYEFISGEWVFVGKSPGKSSPKSSPLDSAVKAAPSNSSSTPLILNGACAGAFDDLNLVYNTTVAEIICKFVTISESLYAIGPPFPTATDFMPFQPPSNTTERISQLPFLAKADFTVLLGTYGWIYENISSYKVTYVPGQYSLLPVLTIAGVHQSGADLTQDEINSSSWAWLQGSGPSLGPVYDIGQWACSAAYIMQNICDLFTPNGLSDFAVSLQQFQNMYTDLMTLCEFVINYASNFDGSNPKGGQYPWVMGATTPSQTELQMADIKMFLVDLLAFCKSTVMQEIVAQYATRLNEYSGTSWFNCFSQDYPGLQHRSGVPFGGTLVLVVHYGSSNGKSTAGQAIDANLAANFPVIQDGIVMADFYVDKCLACDAPSATTCSGSGDSEKVYTKLSSDKFTVSRNSSGGFTNKGSKGLLRFGPYRTKVVQTLDPQALHSTASATSSMVSALLVNREKDITMATAVGTATYKAIVTGATPDTIGAIVYQATLNAGATQDDALMASQSAQASFAASSSMLTAGGVLLIDDERVQQGQDFTPTDFNDDYTTEDPNFDPTLYGPAPGQLNRNVIISYSWNGITAAAQATVFVQPTVTFNVASVQGDSNAVTINLNFSGSSDYASLTFGFGDGTTAVVTAGSATSISHTFNLKNSAGQASYNVMVTGTNGPATAQYSMAINPLALLNSNE